MKPFQTLPRINSRLTNGKLKQGAATLIVAICVASISMVDVARAEFWFEDFTDGSISESGIDWLFSRDHSIEPDGLLLSTDNTQSTAAGPDWPIDRQGWSIRTQGRLLQDHGFIGLASMPVPGIDTGRGAWSVLADESALMGIHDQFFRSTDSDLHPFAEDVVVQLDTLDSTMRMWAWRAGEQPTEDIAPLMIKADLDVESGAPAIWTRSNDGPSSAVFHWMAISTEHMPVNMPIPLPPPIIGDFSGNDILDVADIDMLATAIQQARSDQQFDLNQNGNVDLEDHTYWVRAVKRTWMGDANLDGEFNSSDFVHVFQSGKYETDQIAGWSDGDWNGDARFDSGDFVVAFRDGGFEIGPRASVANVPEPSAAILLTLGLLGIGRIRKR